MDDRIVPVGIEPLCGWQWVYQHKHDLDGWHPSIEVIREGARYKITSTNHKAINQAIKEITAEK